MESTQRMYIREAKKLGDYQSISVNDLADGYCKAVDENNEANKSIYMSALMLRFWYQIGKMQEKVKAVSLYDYDDLVIQLYKCINAACSYRTWQNPEKNTNAQACINQVIASRGAPEILYESNQAKQKVNINCSSLDAQVDEEGSNTYADMLVDEAENDKVRINDSADAARVIIQKFVDKNKLVEAIILDTIAFKDCEKHVKTITKSVDENGDTVKNVQTSSEFWEYKLVKELNNMPEDYKKYFLKYYDVGTTQLDVALDSIAKCNNQKLYKFIRNTLAYSRANADVIKANL